MQKGQKIRPQHSGTLKALYNAYDLITIIHSGEHEEVTRGALARELKLSTKQINRYLDALTEFGVQFETDDDGRIGRNVRLMPVKRAGIAPFNLVALSREELLLLYAILAGLGQAGIGELKERLWEKIRYSLGVTQLKSEQFSSMILNFDKAYKSYDSPDRRRVLRGLLKALYDSCSCRISYQGPHEPKPKHFRIEPYRLLQSDGGLYCYVRVPRYNSVRLIAVERIQDLKPNADKFKMDPDVLEEIEQEQQRAFRVMDDGNPIHVKLRFSPHAAPYVLERQWHPTQRVAMRKDGSLELSFTASGEIEIVRWILGWGGDCQVLSPAALRGVVRDSLKKSLAVHA
jgi:predicted DNA-binding transcriptional regulator YafY